MQTTTWRKSQCPCSTPVYAARHCAVAPSTQSWLLELRLWWKELHASYLRCSLDRSSLVRIWIRRMVLQNCYSAVSLRLEQVLARTEPPWPTWWMRQYFYCACIDHRTLIEHLERLPGSEIQCAKALLSLNPDAWVSRAFRASSKRFLKQQWHVYRIVVDPSCRTVGWGAICTRSCGLGISQAKLSSSRKSLCTLRRSLHARCCQPCRRIWLLIHGKATSYRYWSRLEAPHLFSRWANCSIWDMSDRLEDFARPACRKYPRAWQIFQLCIVTILISIVYCLELHSL